MILTAQNFIANEKIFFISKHTATRVTAGTVQALDSENNELIVKYRDKFGTLVRNRVRPKDAIKASTFGIRGQPASHAFCIVNVRNQITIAPIHTLTNSKVYVTLGGMKFGYMRATTRTGNIIRN